MKCEIIQAGQACKEDAVFVVRTPWTTQLACADCSQSFKRYEVQKLEFTCDWPMGGKECGEPATYYVEVDDGKLCQRPLCAAHASAIQNAKLLDAKTIDDEFDPKLVPYKPPVQPQPRVTQDAAGVARLWCHCGAAAKYVALPSGHQVPLCDLHAQDFRTVASTSLRDAVAEVVYAGLRLLKEKLQPKKGWSKDVQRSGFGKRRS